MTHYTQQTRIAEVQHLFDMACIDTTDIDIVKLVEWEEVSRNIGGPDIYDIINLSIRLDAPNDTKRISQLLNGDSQ